MTNQEIYDKVVRGVLKQGCPSVQDDNPSRCRYRGKGGTKCAAGFLILDEKYTESLEHHMAEGLAVHFPDVVEYTVEQAGLVKALQRAHDSSLSLKEDNYRFVEEFRNKAEMIGFALGLNTGVTSWG